ncbi:MAG: apolipoprotein N-acyltransferase [Aquificae bacterium]|nr:apolipoprotein N-acyltransferase [Aquificota bacterium]
MLNILIPSVIAGILTALSLPYYYLPFGYVAGFIILLHHIYKNKRPLLVSFVAGLSYTALSFYWIVYALSNYGGISFPVAVVLFVVFAVAFSVYQFVIFTFVMTKLKDRNYSLLAVPFVWTTLEILREFFPFSGFPWNLLGYSLSYIDPLAQITSVGSIYLLSFMAMLIPTAIYSAHIYKTDRAYISVFAVFGLFMAVFLWGKDRIENLPISGKSKTVALIQANIDQMDKLSSEATVDLEITLKYLTLIKQALQYEPDIIVLPEAAIPIFPLAKEYNGSLDELFFDGIKNDHSIFIVGFDNVVKDGEDITLYNSMFLLSPEGEIIDYYNKVKLVPFGEYVPPPFQIFQSLFPYLQGYDFSSGEKPKVLKYQDLSIIPLICYEATFPIFVANFPEGNLIVNITNDGWFGDTPAPVQHFEMAKVRAIENGLFMIRSANTGISAIIDPVGDVSIAMGINEEGVALGGVALLERDTIWVKHKETVGGIFIISFIIVLVLIFKKEEEVKIGLSGKAKKFNKGKGTENS